MTEKSSNQELVSVIIPVYNGSDFIADAIECVLQQTYRELEIVVVDDGSTDDSLQVLNKYSSQIKVLHQENNGVASARNAGVQVSKGTYIAFLDQDDLWQPDKVEEQVRQFQRHPGCGLVHTQTQSIDLHTGELLAPLAPHAKPEKIRGQCYKELLLSNDIRNSSVMVARKAFNAVGGCDESLKGNTVADYDLWLRIAQVYQVEFCDSPLTILRRHANQGSHNHIAMLSATIKILLKLESENSWRKSRKRRNRICDIYMQLGRAYLIDGKTQDARKSFWQATKYAVNSRLIAWIVTTYLPRFLQNQIAI